MENVQFYSYVIFIGGELSWRENGPVSRVLGQNKSHKGVMNEEEAKINK